MAKSKGYSASTKSTKQYTAGLEDLESPQIYIL